MSSSPSSSESYHEAFSPQVEHLSSSSANSSSEATTGSLRTMEDDERRSEQFRKLFVGGLTPNVTDDMLKAFFHVFGDITDVVVMKDNKTGRSRGFGFVTFKDPEMVDAAQDARPHILDGKEVETKRAMPREDSDKPEAHMTVKKLFVGALKKDVSSEDLREYFSEFGNIEEAEVMTWKETGESRGFGFVTFDDYDPVDKSILYKPHQIKSSRADVKKALSKEEMAKVKAKQEQHQASISLAPSAAIHLANQAQIAANLAAAGPYSAHLQQGLNPYQFAGLGQAPGNPGMQAGPGYAYAQHYATINGYQTPQVGQPMTGYAQYPTNEGLAPQQYAAVQAGSPHMRSFQPAYPRPSFQFQSGPINANMPTFGACSY